MPDEAGRLCNFLMKINLSLAAIPLHRYQLWHLKADSVKGYYTC